ncbi:MAG: hypothetical protein MRK02_00870 [Candidatus Scalindua sp.]|nr:hypothetical protein [Candidatus Scalindua sp.]
MIEIRAGNIVIAAGSEPVEISSGENMVTSRELLEITSVPEGLWLL